MKLRYFATILAAVIAPHAISAQAVSDSVKHRNDCRLAEQVLTTGEPAPRREWAQVYISYCGFEMWGRSMATAVQRSRNSTDLAALSNQWRRLDFLRDSALFEAATQIA